MSYEALRAQLDVRPFRPFRAVTSSGESYEVRHPEMALVTKTELVVALPDDDGVPSRLRIISTLHVTALEPIDPAGVS